MSSAYDIAMYKELLKRLSLIKEDTILHLKDRYVVRKNFWTSQGDQVKAGMSDNPTIISLYKEGENLIYEYRHFKEINGERFFKIVKSKVNPDCVSLVPDGHMHSLIQVIKAYCEHRVGTNMPEITLLSENRYRVNLWA